MLPRQSLPAPADDQGRPRRAMPQHWLMTDARLGHTLPQIIAAMPPRSGVIIRPYAMAADGRVAMLRTIRRIGRAKRHLLLIADHRTPGFDGRHHGGPAARLRPPSVGSLVSMPVHDRSEAGRAHRIKATLCLVSPVWPTRSHPGARVLGVRGFARLTAGLSKAASVIALGGMNAERFKILRRHGAKGWAAIDGWQERVTAGKA